MTCVGSAPAPAPEGIGMFLTLIRNDRTASRCNIPAPFLILLALVGSLTLTSPAHAAARKWSTLTCKSNTIYDGRGAVIDASRLTRAFNLYSVKNVTIRNYNIIGARKTRVFDIANSTGVKIENITIRTGAAEVVHVHKSSNVAIHKVIADTIDRYLVWVDTSDGVRIARCALLTGSKNETGIRVMDWTTNVIIEGCTIRNRLNKQTALRLHDGSNFIVRWSEFEGHVWVGPMGGNDGGQKVYNLSERVTMLSKTTTNVLFEDVNIYGSIGPQAGLSGFTMMRGTIRGKLGTPFFNSPFNNTTWSYPEAKYAKSSDPVRGAATGVMRGVRFIAPGRSTLNYNDNGPFRLLSCSLNGKPVRG